MFSGIHPWNYLILGFSLLVEFWILNQFHKSLFVWSRFFFVFWLLHDSILVHCILVLVEIYPFLSPCLLAFFIMICMLWCQLQFLLFHLKFYWLSSIFLFVSLAKALSILLSFPNTNSWIQFFHNYLIFILFISIWNFLIFSFYSWSLIFFKSLTLFS